MASASELERLRSFCDIVVGALPVGGDRELAIRAELLLAIRGASSLKAARTIASDLLEWTQDLSGQALADLDQSLAERGLPTLSLMRSRADAWLAQIFQRGRIASHDEYRLVNARLADTASSLSDGDRALGEQLLADFIT